ncbi:MAG: leucine-rich repeat domain-containing protein, partial [Lachnospiraceae bacterium]|nr:leucine-rich repeat domain-containing protein [Lachnospiraceae bacterium]
SDQLLEEDPPSEEEPSEEEVELLDDFEPEKAPEEPEEEDQQEIKAYFGAREFVATGVFPENAELVVIPVEKEDIEESIDEDFIIYEAYDISIMADDIKWEPDDDDLVNIIIKNIKFSNEDDVEEEFDYTDTTVLHIDDDDNVEAIACDVTEEDGGYHSLEFKTPGFSTFVIGGYTYNTDNALRTWNIGINGSSSVKASMFYLNTVDDSDGYELIISGTGATKDYGSGDFAPWYSEPYKSKLKSVYISEGITTLGGCSFYTNSNITTVTLPSTLTAIRDYAFCSCSGLAITSLPDSITSVGYCSFWGCSQMAITKFPDSLSTLGAYAFAYCSMMDPVSIPSGITVIPDYAFSTCYRWTIKEIPEGVTSIGDHAFDGCSRIKELTLPSTLTHIGSGAFDMLINCNKGIHLNNVTLADDHEVTLFHYNDDNEYVDTLRAGVLYNVTLTRDKKQDSVEVIIRFEDYNGSTRPDSLTVVFGAVYSSGDTLRKTINLGDMSGSAPNIHFYESVDKFYTELINIPFDPPEGYDIAVQRADTAEATVEFIFTLKTNYTVSLPAMIDNISDGGAITVSGVIPKRKVLRVRNVGDGDHMTELTNGNGSSIKIKFGSFSPGGYTGLLGYEGLQYLSRAFYGENHEGYLDFGSDAPEYSQKLLGTITSAGYYKPHDFPTDADAVNYYYHPIAYVGGIYTPHYQYLGKELTEEGGNGPISMSQEGNNGVFALDYAVDNTAENLAILGDKGTVDGSYILFKDKSMLSRLGYDAGTYTGNLVFSWSVEDNPYR